MGEEQKIAVLVKVASVLNENNIAWAIGGSYLCYIKGVEGFTKFNDFDVSTSGFDIGKIIAPLLEKLNGFQSYREKDFCEGRIECVLHEFIIDGIGFDFGDCSSFSEVSLEVADSIHIKGISIPLQSVKKWGSYYESMGRAEKSAKCKEHIE
ncbi:MAG: hypothetical protein FWC89_12420 [Defluviitaleaceae bacterium]|nr:hypothetical protein [Defluviitaleaceae bacterium]